MCLYPRLIKNRKYTSTKKNGGVVPPLPLIEVNGKMIGDLRVLEVPVGCGKCIECMKQKSREWQVRLLEDIRHNKNGVFVTLTFSNESIKELSAGIRLEGYERDNEIAKQATRKFLERWRKKYKKSVRHWLVTELGHENTENIHMHGILWTDEKIETIAKIWKYGYIYPRKEEQRGYVNEQTVNYITKYINKIDEIHKEYKPKILTSAGIGKGYLERSDSNRNKYKKGETKEGYKTRTGHEVALPIYWRNKIYTEEEKEKLWIEKLDKEERWVMGEKIDISKGEEQYNKVREYYRKKNKRLGYGDDRKNWEQKIYENERRNINFKKRIEANESEEMKIKRLEEELKYKRYRDTKNKNKWK